MGGGRKRPSWKKGNPEKGETILPSPALEEVQVILAVEDVSGEPNTPRHLEELHELFERMDRGHGTWSTSHPRHRLLDALHGFSKYEELQKAEIKRLRGLFENVSKSQKNLLNRAIGYGHKLSKAEHLVHENNMFCQHVVDNALEFYRVTPSELDDHIRQVEASGKVAEKVSVSQALKHVVRDWTASGVVEREEAYACIAQTMSQLFPDRDSSVGVKVLLPGAGLGRLGHEIAKLGGFEVTNNEWSMYMNVMYRFIEGHRARLSESFYPFVDGWSHHATTSNMFRRLDFPDTAVNATAVVLVEGDFTTAFHATGNVFHAVITHFFIDTARNLMSYFETIDKLLVPGGYWINFGPLLYGSAPFVQLSLEEIVQIVEEMGLEFLDTEEKCGELTLPGKKVRSLEAVYGFDDLALFKNAYKSQFWVARKKQ